MHHLQSYSNDQGSENALPGAISSTTAADGDALFLPNNSDHVSLDVSPERSTQQYQPGFVPLNEIEADRLKEIERDLRLKLILADWQSRLKESQERKERKQSLSLNVKNEIYQLIGFFSVFQGVVLTTVSQASQLTCHNWWGPFALSLLASITTLFGVCNKFHNFIKWKRATDVEVENSKVLS